MRIALDTNILVYAEGADGEARQTEAKAVIATLGSDDIMLPVQVLAELFAVQVRKSGLAPQTARLNVLRWANAYTPIDTSAAILAGAMELVGRHRITFWDAVVMASAASAECRQLLSEDFQDGFTWRGVTARDPFALAHR